MDAAQALTGGSSHNQPVHTPRAVDRCGSQDTSQAALPNTQTDKVPADPKVQLRRVLQQTPFLSESVPLAPGGKEKPDRQDFPAQAPAPTQGLSEYSQGNKFQILGVGTWTSLGAVILPTTVWVSERSWRATWPGEAGRTDRTPPERLIFNPALPPAGQMG